MAVSHLAMTPDRHSTAVLIVKTIYRHRRFLARIK